MAFNRWQSRKEITTTTTSSRIVLLVLFTCFLLAGCTQKKPTVTSALKMRIQEGYPDSVVQALTEHESAITSSGDSSALQSVISRSRVWEPRRILTVAFQGGSVSLRTQIVETLKPWTDAANVVLDFGPLVQSGQFREWSNSDNAYAADIRISFRGGVDGGYWSQVGRDSRKLSLAPPGRPSMNFEGFPEELPPDWQATVLHEFGHALGFEHEHQSPVAPCEQEFRWDDDPGYMKTRDTHQQFVPDTNGRRPGIYTVLEGPPNSWTEKQINFNLRQLPYSTDLLSSEFDKQSIMKYYFETWMFKNGAQSKCYNQQNLQLSAQDTKAASETYPTNEQEIRVALNSQAKAVQQLTQTPGLPNNVRSPYIEQFRELKRMMRR